MLTESDIEALMAEVILGAVKNPAHKTNIKDFCAENQLDRRKLTSKKLFSMKNPTLFRIMMGIAQGKSLKVYLTVCLEFAFITYYVANLTDGSPEIIKKAHMGSPIGRKGNNQRRYLNNCTGYDYNHQTIDQVVADERRISELSIAFAQELAMIIQDMDHQKWDLFWANLGNYLFEEDD